MEKKRKSNINPAREVEFFFFIMETSEIFCFLLLCIIISIVLGIGQDLLVWLEVKAYPWLMRKIKEQQ